VPLSAERAEVGFPPAFDSGEERGVQGIALAAEPPLARAHPLSLFLRGLLHCCRRLGPGSASATSASGLDRLIYSMLLWIVRQEKWLRPFFFGSPEDEIRQAASSSRLESPRRPAQ